MRRLLFVGLSALAGCREPSATLYTNARVLTLDPARPTATGLRLEGEQITHVFSGEPEGLSGKRVDLGGATVLPGLADAHIHLQDLGAVMRQIDLSGAKSAQEAAERVRQAAAKAPAGAVLRGANWDQNLWPGAAFPSRLLLDEAAPRHLVWLDRVDGHAAWVNSAVLEHAGLGRQTKDPRGGEIMRDSAGDPTGILVDAAMDLALNVLPTPSAEEVRGDVERALQRCLAAGLTAVHDMGTTTEALNALRALEGEDKLPLRVDVFHPGSAADIEARIVPPADRQGLLRVTGVKLFADGALGSRGAALLSSYDDAPSSTGLVVTAPERLDALARLAHQRGYQVTIHAIGDRGVQLALEAIAKAQGGDRSLRHRIEHVQVLAPGDVARLAGLGIVASMQPSQAVSDGPWAVQRIGVERMRRAYAWKTLLEQHTTLAFGSDAPVESESPWAGIAAALEGGFEQAQRLSFEQALTAYTRGAAEAVQATGRGVIAPGATADLTIVKQDPSGLTPAELRAVAAERVVVAGRQVYLRP